MPTWSGRRGRECLVWSPPFGGKGQAAPVKLETRRDLSLRCPSGWQAVATEPSTPAWTLRSFAKSQSRLFWFTKGSQRLPARDPPFTEPLPSLLPSLLAWPHRSASPSPADLCLISGLRSTYMPFTRPLAPAHFAPIVPPLSMASPLWPGSPSLHPAHLADSPFFCASSGC